MGFITVSLEAVEVQVKWDDSWPHDCLYTHIKKSEWSRPEVSSCTHEPIPANSLSLHDLKQKAFLRFQIVEEKNQKDILLHENHKIQISILISKFLLDTHSYALYPVYGYFYVTVAKLSSLNYLLSGLLEKSLLTLDLDTLKCLLASSICLNRGSDHLLLLLS